MEAAILELLETNGSLAYYQVAALLDERPDDVRDALSTLRDRGLIDVLSFGELRGTNAASYWRLTDAGRAALAQLRSTS